VHGIAEQRDFLLGRSRAQYVLYLDSGTYFAECPSSVLNEEGKVDGHALELLPEPPRKVAFLRASRIGDFICATPAFRALRAALPEAEITIVTLPILKDLALRSLYLDRFAAFPGFPGIAEQFFEARTATRFIVRMQAEQFDLAIQMQGSGVYSNPFTLLLGAKKTAGFIREGDSPGLLDAALPLPVEGLEIDQVLAAVDEVINMEIVQ
jgi:ADP-heptose:LPS heptosyltransferase